VKPLLLPVADGGEGTFDILCKKLRAEIWSVDTFNPWRDPVIGSIGLTPDLFGLIELSQASGINTPHKGPRDPVSADTYGTGILIREAIAAGARNILVGTGGSATTDGGRGAVTAISESGGLKDAKISVLCDVTTTFTEAARVFGPQKGADSETVKRLTARLEDQANTYPKNPTGVLRSGAAGGFSGALWAFFDAELVSGADYVLDAVGFNAALEEVDAVVVGEGRLDSQTEQGKIIQSILLRVKKRNRRVPVFAVVGSLASDLGNYKDYFTDIIVASNKRQMQAAGSRIVEKLLG
jgi:glycerate kinase